MTLAVAGTTQYGYNLNRSLRFRASASAYMNRTPASAGSRRIMTYSFWVKKTQDIADNANQTFFGAGSYAGGTQQTGFMWATYTGSSINNSIRIQSGTQGVSQDFDFAFANTYRDYAGWYHIVVAFDTTQATAANRCKVYVNGNQLGSPVAYAGRSTTISQNYDLALNNNVAQLIGQSGSSNYLDGYMAEVNFIDGQQLTPSSFGSTNPVTGVWQPAKYTGTYGTNGFYLPFTNTTSTTTLGYDSSGNGNNWTTNNFSLTAGSTYDSMYDVPTLTSATIANYCVGNPNASDTSATSPSGLTNGNLSWRVDNTRAIVGTIAMSSGAWYWEHTITNIITNIRVGIVSSARYFNGNNTDPSFYSDGYSYISSGSKENNNSTTAYGASYTVNDVIGVAFDATAGTLTFYKNNVSQGTAYTGISGSFVAFAYGTGVGNTSCNVNFGQQPFTYTPPAGYVALNTYNLPASTIVQGNKYMDATLYTGTGANVTVTNSGSFQPDLVWNKGRSNASSSHLTDSVRGVNKVLYSDLNYAEATYSNDIYAFNTNGYSVGSDGSQSNNGWTYVGWQWQAGQGTTSNNTSGSIASTVSVSTSAGFSIATYTGTGSAATVGHGLGVAPSMVIVKRRNTTESWQVYHTGLTSATYCLQLNSTAAQTSASTVWNSTAPTSSVFSVGTDTATNASGSTYVGYCWAQIAGFSKFGSYTGNGSTDGPFVYTGFRPKFVMIKRYDASGQDWILWDSARPTYNTTYILYPNTAAVEDTAGNIGDILSNGFKPRSTGLACNANGGTFIYAAFAENPFKYALAR